MTLRDFYLKRAKAEFPVFLKVLRALPEDLSYKPHDRSPSAEQLVWTLTNELKALINVVDTGKSEWEDSKPPSRDEMIGMFEKWSTELLDKVAALDDASQERNAQFLYQGTVVMEKPMVEFLWDFMFDAIHHRGQLSAYLRPMGGKVPSIYGPSADDTGM
ncbi:MAG: DinB family protein [Pyrinomonadaceae bacterium]